MMMLELHFDKVLARLGSDFGCQKPCQNGSRLRFGALKASCWANLLQNDMICCIFWCPPLYVNVRFHCENTGVLNDFHFAFSLLNVILFPLKLYCKSFKMRPKIASESVFFGVQGAYSFRVVSKLNFEANFVSQMGLEMLAKIGTRMGYESLRSIWRLQDSPSNDFGSNLEPIWFLWQPIWEWFWANSPLWTRQEWIHYVFVDASHVRFEHGSHRV